MIKLKYRDFECSGNLKDYNASEVGLILNFVSGVSIEFPLNALNEKTATIFRSLSGTAILNSEIDLNNPNTPIKIINPKKL